MDHDSRKFPNEKTFVWWWVLHGLKSYYPRGAGDGIAKLCVFDVDGQDPEDPSAEQSVNMDHDQDHAYDYVYVRIRDQNLGSGISEEIWLDRIEANIIMGRLDKYEHRAVISYFVSERDVRSGRKMSGISSVRLYNDKLRSGRMKLREELRRKGMLDDGYTR